MKNIIYKSLALLLFTLSFTSCEREITVEIPQKEESIVVEGRIELDTIAVVFLSKTLPFFGEINFNDIVQNTITGATVIVQSDVATDTLVQIPGIGVYIGQNIRGEAGKSYKLTVLSGGKTITSVTSIPNPLYLDSVWWKPEENNDSLGFAWAHLHDPDTLGNGYQWLAKRINKYTYGDNVGEVKDSTFIPARGGGTFGDRFFNATEFDFNFFRGSYSFSDKEDDQNDERFYFKRGDTVVVKFCSIDLATYEFWRTENEQVENNGNPFGSPAPVTSNITGGLGIWGGYSATYDTIIAQ